MLYSFTHSLTPPAHAFAHFMMEVVNFAKVLDEVMPLEYGSFQWGAMIPYELDVDYDEDHITAEMYFGFDQDKEMFVIEKIMIQSDIVGIVWWEDNTFTYKSSIDDGEEILKQWVDVFIEYIKENHTPDMHMVSNAEDYNEFYPIA